MRLFEVTYNGIVIIDIKKKSALKYALDITPTNRLVIRVYRHRDGKLDYGYLARLKNNGYFDIFRLEIINGKVDLGGNRTDMREMLDVCKEFMKFAREYLVIEEV